jgi:hypothetical protein
LKKKKTVTYTIERVFLSEYSSKDCLIHIIQSQLNNRNFPADLEQNNIRLQLEDPHEI